MVVSSQTNKEDLEKVWKRYNVLPALVEADCRFQVAGREEIFGSLARLLSKYGNRFGVCLIHTHCLLAPGEIILEKGDISEPVCLSDVTTCYANRWLPSGEPFEFTIRPTQAPSDLLIGEFRALTSDIGVLGLYYTGADEVEEVKLEWTEGRRNLVRTMEDEDWRQHPVETAWNLGRGEPVTMACILLCARATTESGGAHLKKQVHHRVK